MVENPGRGAARLRGAQGGDDIGVAIVMGDLNETRTDDDRRWVRLPGGDDNVIEHPRASRALYGDDSQRRCSMVDVMCTTGGFTDTVRERHPRGGFTCGTPMAMDGANVRRTESRIDFVLMRDTRNTHEFKALRVSDAQRTAVCAAAVLSPSPFGAWPKK